MPTEGPGPLAGRPPAGWPLARWLEARRREVDELLASRLAARPREQDPGRLVEAMRYSLLAPGKRLRPLLALGAAEAVDGPRDEAVALAACAVELVHCYSLVHDDLPAMDDDDFRRGRPSNHKVYGEATAILVGDALLTLAFEWLAEAGLRSGRPDAFGRAALALARGAGVAGMVRGQARDLAEPPPEGLEDLERLHAEKTAALFGAAAEVGAAAAGGRPDDVDALGAFGRAFGLAFQHIDDRDDGDHVSSALAARKRLPVLIADACAALDRLSVPGRGAILRDMASGLLDRAETPTGPLASPR